MRTGNKLLLSFVAFMVLMMLLTDVLLWANFKRGIMGDMDERGDNQRHTVTLQPVKVVKITSNQNYNVNIEKADSFRISYSIDTLNQILYSQIGDTLFVQPREEGFVTIGCPEIETILLVHSGVALNDLHLSHLNILAGDVCTVGFAGSVEIGALHITGGRENSIHLSGKIDSLYLQLGPKSSFSSDDVPYKFTSMKLDSLDELNLNGSSLKALKEIK
jgi:hypothetical protein